MTSAMSAGVADVGNPQTVVLSCWACGKDLVELHVTGDISGMVVGASAYCGNRRCRVNRTARMVARAS